MLRAVSCYTDIQYSCRQRDCVAFSYIYLTRSCTVTLTAHRYVDYVYDFTNAIYVYRKSASDS